MKLGFFKDITNNALIDPHMKIARARGAKCPNTVVEGRNAVFLLAASVWAKALGAKVVFTGVSQADFSGYPDCRAVFIRAQERAIRLALDYQVKIVTPFINTTKAEEWALGTGLESLTSSSTKRDCHRHSRRGCGKCPACRLRAGA